jgi:opacity protein-like surface antigen
MMKVFFYKFFLPVLFILFIATPYAKAQYATKKVRSKHEAYTDSLKQVKYNYVFPFWGQKAYARGIDIQYPIGFMGNFFWTRQGITIDDFELGFENAHNGIVDFPLTPVSDSILGFGNNQNTAYSLNVRPDIWLFPFIDLYGIFGIGHSTTSVNVLLFPQTPNEQSFTSIVDQSIATYGVGVMVAGGVGPVWISLDANMTWNKPALLDKPTIANVVGLRMGHVFVFKNRPQSNISLWIGTMFLTMQSKTTGAVKLADALPPEIWDKKDAFVKNYHDWYNNEATPAQKIVADKILTPIVDAVDQRNGESVVKYKMNKQTKQHWNGLVGIQYQINKHWQIRSEGGVIGDRKSILFSVNYRLLGFKKVSKSF